MFAAFSVDQIKAAEAPLLTAGVPLMQRAAFALSLEIIKLLRTSGKVRGSRVLLLVGSGNNGGDALYAGAYLARRGVGITAVLCGAQAHTSGLAELRAAGGTAAPLAEANLADLVGRSSVLVDGLLGIGSRGAVRGEAASAIFQVLSVLADLPAAARPRTVAVDIPSGIGVDDGEVPGPVIPADLTVTFGAAKPGLLLPPAALLAGAIKVVDIGISLSTPQWQRLSAKNVAELLHPATATDHKYRRGVVELTVGSAQYPGAGLLAVAGALGSGAGAVRFTGPEDLRSLLISAHPEVLLGSGRHDALVLGCGVPAEQSPPLHEEYLRQVAEAVRRRVPVVLDAGGLQLVPALLARAEGKPLPSTVVLTPHAAELARLMQVLDPSQHPDPVVAPAAAAAALHHCTGATVVLKGAVTVIHGPSRWAQGPGNSWLATAGSGDVLAGLLGGLLATAQQRHQAGNQPGALDPAALAAAAVYLHSAASQLANPAGPVTASQVAAALPRAWAATAKGATP